MTPEILLRRADFDEILGLRHAVLRPGRPLATARFEGDDDPGTVHLGAFPEGGGDAVGCATLMHRPWRGAPAWQLRGMATRADLARRGIGRALLRLAEEAVRAEGGPLLLWCNARLEAIAFYAGAGWEEVSGTFEVPDVGPHREMLRRLA